jgi:hypothetical protein
MKKPLLFYFLFLTFFLTYAEENAFIEGVFFKRGSFFILNLPYEIDNNDLFVFDEDTPYAIDIIKIYADGEELSFIEDIRDVQPRTYYRVHEIITGRRNYFISMYWMPWYSGEVLRWNDGRGIFFTQLTPTRLLINIFSYEISRGMNVLEITYRIVLPYPSLSIENLSDKSYENKRYTREYRIRVDISNVFDL